MLELFFGGIIQTIVLAFNVRNIVAYAVGRQSEPWQEYTEAA